MMNRNKITALFRSACLLTLSAFTFVSFSGITALADSDRWESTTYRNEDNNIHIDFEELRVVLPSDWAGKCQMGVSEDSVAFYHTTSRQQCTEEFGYPCGGLLFAVNFSEDLEFMVHPNYELIGRVADGYYYASFPTDVQGYMNDAETLAEYGELHNDIEWVKANYSITVEELPMNSGVDLSAEYIFPTSNSEYLTEADLAGLTKSEIQMAINEVYARHHRKFVLKEVQDHFNSKSWYTGTIEAADFNVNVMNQYEGTNINLMVECMKTAPDTRAEVPAPAAAAGTADAYGQIIESGSGYFIIRQEDGSSIQFWYDHNKLADMGLSESDLATGSVVSLIYDLEEYEALEILVF